MADSHSIRASVYDVFLELGALDANSRAAAWFFGDPNSSLSDIHRPAAEMPREAVRFASAAPSNENDGVQRDVRPSRPTSRTSFASKFSPKRMRSKTKSTVSTGSSLGTVVGDGYDTDEGYSSASPTNSSKAKSRFRAAAFTLRSPTTGNKPLPALPPIKEKPVPTRSSSAPAMATTVSRAKSLFKKRTKSPEPASEPRKSSADSLMQWQQVANITPRTFNPSAQNGEALVSPSASPPSNFRQLTGSSTADAAAPRQERLSFALPRSVFRSLTLTKRRTSARLGSRIKSRPKPLDLEPASATRLASSLPASPYILVTEDVASIGTMTPRPFPGTPFVFVTPIDNPTPLHSATMRRFSDVTSMTAPLGMGVYPLSISRTLRRSMTFDTLDVPGSPPARLRPSSSYSSFQDALQQAASAASPYEMYDEPISRIRRGVESPFPAHPILQHPLSTNFAQESRLATIQRYREFSEQLVEVMPYKRFTRDHLH
ncbi:hypothetical protein C8F01DRAFT_1148606 [Mycena amicta]|nr:hypothetical protein C8F01DRAFT_1148606 [Mycena amicta]